MAENETQTRRDIGALTVEIIEILVDVLLLLGTVIWSFIESAINYAIPRKAKSVKGEVVLVTGAGHGIGKELALLYASLGATVIVWEINEPNGLETVKEIARRNYPKAYFYKCDVSNREEILSLAKQVQKDVGDVTILVNNAGIMPTHPLLHHPSAEIEKIININVMAHFWTLEAFLPAMKRNNYGHIVCLTSTAGLFGVPNLVPYCASKYAVRGLMEALHEELRVEGKDGIKFTSIYPYMVNTGLVKKAKIRFSNLMKMIEPKDLAAEIVDAQRKNIKHRSVPRYFLFLEVLLNTFPEKARISVMNFLGVSLESDIGL